MTNMIPSNQVMTTSDTRTIVPARAVAIRRTNTPSRRGSAIMSIVIGVVVLAVIGFGIAFFTSDVFRTRAQSAMEQWSDWTPENIAKYPEEYLNFCERETKAAMEALRVREIDVAQQQARLEQMKSEHGSAVSTGDKALSELKTLYREAEASSAWPATWRGNSYTQDQLKNQIVRIHNELEGKRKVLSTVESGLRELEARKQEIAKAKIECEDQISQIQTNRQMLAVQKITDDLKNQLVDMRSAISGVVAIASPTDGGSFSLDDLQSQDAGSVSDDEFNAIMGG